MATQRAALPAGVEEPRSEVVRLIPALRAFARTFCKNTTDADDLVQETLVKAIANIEKFEPGTSMKSWLFTIMRNTFYTRIKVLNRESPAAADCASSQPVIPATQEWSVRGREIAHAVQQLPEEQRQVLVLIGVLGVSYLDAASICGCAIGTIKSRLNRARSRLLEVAGEATSGDMVRVSDYSQQLQANRNASAG
jgi:RNA polymerase sigma factor (sigma-70 family)